MHLLQAVGSHGAAALRPLLSRAAVKGAVAVRRATLNAAEQQKMILCSALLSEVAMTFGFKLRISNPYGVPAVASDEAAEAKVEPKTTADENAASCPSAGRAPFARGELQDLDVVIARTEDYDAEDDQMGDEPSPRLSNRKTVVGMILVPLDDTFDSTFGSLYVLPCLYLPQARGQRPQLQLGGRLTASALAGALVLGKKAGGGAVSGAKKRLEVKSV